MTKELSKTRVDQVGKVEQHFRQVENQDIRIGEPLPYDVYNRHGLMLMPEGAEIASLTQLQQLLDAGLFMLINKPERIVYTVGEHQPEQQAFLMLDDVKIQLENLFHHIRTQKAKGIFESQVMLIARHIQQAIRLERDAALASLHLDCGSPYIVQHSLHAALNMAIVSDLLDIDENKKLIMVCAALTHDIGLLDIQNTLDQQSEPLTHQQRQRVNAHPEDGIQILKSYGISDPIWLNAVHHHHERIDGSGYPLQLAKSDIKIPARLLAITDCYSAMVRPRPYRKAMVSKQVLRNLLFDESQKLDHRLVEMLIKTSGMFPAGVMVRLESGEIAVVKKQQEDISSPLVYVFIKADGNTRAEPLLRNTQLPNLAIQGILPLGQYQSHVSILRNLWLLPHKSGT